MAETEFHFDLSIDSSVATTERRSVVHRIIWRHALAAWSIFLSVHSLVVADPSGGTMIVKTVEPDVLRGRVVSLSLTNGLMLETSAAPIHIPLMNLVRLTSTTESVERAPRETSFTLVGSDRLYGRLIEGNDDNIIVETADLGRVTLPLEFLERIEVPQIGEAGFRDAVSWFDEQPSDSEDRVLLTNGDVTRGFVSSIDSEGVVLEGSAGPTRIPHRLIVSLRLATPKSRPIDTPHAVVSFTNSGRVTVRSLEWRDDAVAAQLVAGPAVQCKVESIARIDFLGGRWEWLSGYAPISDETVPMLSLHWDSRPDQNVLGGPITVAGESFERGIGVHSRSKLAFDLRGAYREFVTSYGMDDDSGPLADVSVMVLVDGQRRHNQPEVRKGKLFGPFRMDITRANRIELVVDFGKNGDLQDRFDWVEAALIRNAENPTNNDR